MTRPILFVNPVGALGGAERVLLALLAGLRQSAPDLPVRVLTFGPGPLLERAQDLGATVELLPLPAALAELGEGGAGGGKLAAVRRLVRVR